jgi:hypothetical protein
MFYRIIKQNLDKVSVVIIKVFFIIFVKELEGNLVNTKKWLQLSQIMKTAYILSYLIIYLHDFDFIM